jgi:hypothetical protein
VGGWPKAGEVKKSWTMWLREKRGLDRASSLVRRGRVKGPREVGNSESGEAEGSQAEDVCV